MSSHCPAPPEFDDSDDDFEIDLDAKFDNATYDDYNPDYDDYAYSSVNNPKPFDKYLNGMVFDYELGEEDLVLMDKLCVFYNATDEPKSLTMGNKLLLEALEEKKTEIFNDNPYIFTLKLIINTDTLDDPHIKSIPYKIMMGLKEFVRKQDVDQQAVLKCMITDFIKEVAFQISYKHLTFFKVIVSIYELTTPCEQIINRLKKMLDAKDYKTVARIIESIGYFNEFGPEEIIIPLIFRDALQIAEDLIVRMSFERKYETLLLLDSFLENETTCDLSCKKFAKEHKITGIKEAKLSVKPLMKTIRKLLSLCQIHSEKLPNMTKLITTDRLCNLLKHRYIDQTTNSHHSDFAIKELVPKDAKDLQELVIEHCVQFGHFKEARKWCEWFEIPETRFHIQDRKMKQEFDENQNKTETSVFPPFLISHNVKIITIQDTPGYLHMCAGFERMRFVAMDVEGDFRSTGAALIQISTTKYVFIIDVTTLEARRFEKDDWLKLKSSLFDNTNILKIGFNWNADVSMLDRTFHWKLDLTNGSYIDMQQVWTSLCENLKFKLPFQYNKGDFRKHQDLKTFVEHCTGKTLDKTMKKSDFSVRPLPEKMMRYAATDAHSLLHSFFVLKKEAHNCGVDINLMTIK